MSRPPQGLTYDEGYSERAALSDGTPIHLRLLRPEDGPRLVRAFEQLSPQSRYRRFLSARTALTPGELHYLIDLNQTDHFALGAELLPEGHSPALGVARFIRDSAQPTVAEPAIAVVDDYQRQGLGRLLLPRLVAAARERGIDRFQCEVLADNEALRALLASLAPNATQVRDGEVFRVEVPLPPPSSGVDGITPLGHLMAQVARGGLQISRRLFGSPR